MAQRSFRSVFLALALAAAPVQAAVADTLSDVLVTAYRNSNLLAANRAVLRARDEGVAQALSRLRPALSASSRLTDSDEVGLDNTIGLTLDLLVFDFGRTRLGVASAKETVLAARYALVDAEQEVLLDAVTAYMDMRRERQTVALAENSLRLNQQELRAARDRFEVGEITRTDVSQAEAAVAEAQSTLAASRGQLEIARTLFNLAVGVYPGDLQVAPPMPEIPGNLEAATRIGVQTHPTIRQAQHLVRAADLNVEGARAAMRPRLDLQGTVSRSEDRDFDGGRNDATASLNLNVPIYQGGQLRSILRENIANSEESRANLLQNTLLIEDEVTRAWAQLQVARASIAARRQQIRAEELAFEGVREEAKLGARTTLDVLDAEQDLLEARNNLVGAQRDEYVAVYTLLSAMGLLTVEHLGLSIEGYDPTVNYNKVRNAPAQSVRGDRLDRVIKRTGGN